jgi:hypothetical protein
MKIISMLPWADWLAVLTFCSLWVGYAWVAKVRGLRDQSLIATTNRYRQMWMMQATARDPRMLDGLITQNLSQTPPTRRLSLWEKSLSRSLRPCSFLSSRFWSWLVFLFTRFSDFLGLCGNTPSWL